MKRKRKNNRKNPHTTHAAECPHCGQMGDHVCFPVVIYYTMRHLATSPRFWFVICAVSSFWNISFMLVFLYFANR